MQVRMVAAISGTRNGADWPPRGGILDLPEDEARQLLAAGMTVEDATALDAEASKVAPVEDATAPDTATTRRRKR